MTLYLCICCRSLFLHVSLPGQEAGSPELEAGYRFPSLDSLGLQLVTVLDTLHIKQVR